MTHWIELVIWRNELVVFRRLIEFVAYRVHDSLNGVLLSWSYSDADWVRDLLSSWLIELVLSIWVWSYSDDWLSSWLIEFMTHWIGYIYDVLGLSCLDDSLSSWLIEFVNRWVVTFEFVMFTWIRVRNLHMNYWLCILWTQCVAVCCSLSQSLAVCNNNQMTHRVRDVHIAHRARDIWMTEQIFSSCERSLLQSVAVCCSLFQSTAVCCSLLLSCTVCCSLSQSVAVCRSLLQSAAVCYSLLQSG